MAAQLMPVAQYVRMSTEHQQYSIQNQSEAIKRYADEHNFEIVKTYADHGRSGLTLRYRSGLRQLLQDVAGGQLPYRRILVYDVSRWGRFQDTDEAAHYEFLCRSAGVPVVYCAEEFSEEINTTNAIMKFLKRTMAAEFSRELGVKAYAGHKRLAQLGFKVGGVAGYGLRRLLVSPRREPIQILPPGVYKAQQTDHVILVPGPPREVAIVREIFQMVTRDRMRPLAIMDELNRRRIPFRGGAWSCDAVFNLLRNPQYIGWNVWGKTSQRLKGRTIKLPPSQWIVTENAFKPLVSKSTFVAAQRALLYRHHNTTDEQLLNDLRRLLKECGYLSPTLVDNHRELASESCYRKRFGTLKRAYELIGYTRPQRWEARDRHRLVTRAFRRKLVLKIVRMFPGEVTLAHKNRGARPVLQVHRGPTLSVMAVRQVNTPLRRKCWPISVLDKDKHGPFAICLLNEKGNGLHGMYLVPKIDDARTRFWIYENDPWLAGALPIPRLGQFCRVARQLTTEMTLPSANRES